MFMVERILHIRGFFFILISIITDLNVTSERDVSLFHTVYYISVVYTFCKMLGIFLIYLKLLQYSVVLG